MFRTICVAAALTSLLSCAQPTDCRNWTTYQFFVTASVEDVAGCIAAGADVTMTDEDGGTALHLAALGAQDPAVIEVLIAAGADAGARDKAARTPLHWAALINENPVIFAALINAGADVNARDVWGQTPLYQATLVSKNLAVMEVLIAAGAK
ncbi:ankyrin repeat domain-containing protein [Yoonia sp.]|uniref:ankyrin repeat domain-containing protein n=1 Tax=Yoonia sp. TaxID=2212373 RepID=UPI002332E832|nr:ankyrin repeat domain-containing protein [Yoonia sp.]MDB4254774.1 ankyrin repeat domain-containing protein [bacterium]